MMYEVIVSEIQMRAYPCAVIFRLTDREERISLPMTLDEARTFMLGDKHIITVNG